MKYREYKILQSIYDLNPQQKDDQHYNGHFISNIEAKGHKKDEVLAFIDAHPEYFSVAKNKDGYVHLVAITCRGVSAVRYYKQDAIWSCIRNILIPAIVSIVCSLIVNYST